MHHPRDTPRESGAAEAGSADPTPGTDAGSAWAPGGDHHREAGWIARAKQCPNCGAWTLRRRTPVLLRPVRWVLRDRVSYRACRECGWQGLFVR